MTEVGEGVCASNIGPIPFEERDCEGDPIDVVTGEVFATETDVVFLGPISIELVRSYSSACVNKSSIFGQGWSSTLEAYIEIYNKDIYFKDFSGRELLFPLVDKDKSYYCLAEKVTINRSHRHITITDQRGNIFKFSKIENGYRWLLKEISNQNNRKMEFCYEKNNLVNIIIPDCGSYRIEYNSKNTIDSIFCRLNLKDSEIRLRKYEYDDQGRLFTVFDELFQGCFYEYDNDNRMIKKVNRSGLTYIYEYNEDGRCVKAQGENKLYYRAFNYSISQRKTEVVNSLGHKTSYFWNKFGLVSMVINSLGGIRQYYYNENRMLIGKVDENKNTTNYEYDSNGNLIAIIDQERNRREFSYGDGYVEEIDPAGIRIVKRYDDKDQLISIEYPDGGVSKYIYDEQGDIVEILNELGESIINLEKGSKGNELVLKDSDGNSTVYKYDDWERLICIRDAVGNEEKYEYDIKGRIVAIIDANGNRTAYGYDSDDNLIWKGDSLGQQCKYFYNKIGLLTKRIDENENCVEYDYDSEGNMTSILNEKNEKYLFIYDSLGRLVHECGFDGQTKEYDYDPVGNLISLKKSNGSSIHYIHDKNYRIVEIWEVEHGKSKLLVTFSYNKSGKLIESKNDYRVLKFEYDLLGNIIKEFQGDQVVEMRYDIVGRLVERKSPFEHTVHFKYCLNNQISDIAFQLGKNLKYNYTETGKVSKVEIFNRISIDYSYDPIGNITSQQVLNNDVQIINRTYKYDKRNFLTQLEDGKYGASLYEYNAVGQLLKAFFPHKAPKIYRFDPTGNLLSDGDYSQYQYQTGNLIKSFNNTTYHHDGQGNIVKINTIEGIYRFKYNNLGQLDFVEKPNGDCIEYRYDPLGRRFLKINNKEITEYYWHGDKLVGEITENDQIEYVIHPENHTPIALIKKEELYIYINDHLGTPRDIVSEEGKVVWHGDYQPFGACTLETDIAMNNIRFPGQYYDKETGFHYNYFRYYDPQLGRYLSPDPIGLDSGNNFYVYANGNPLNYIDPKGDSAQACIRRFAFGPLAYLFPPRHCYMAFSDGTTLSWDNSNKVHADPVPNTWFKSCSKITNAKGGCSCTDKCIKDKMKECEKSPYKFFSHNCCDCVRSALNKCKCNTPLSIKIVNYGF